MVLTCDANSPLFTGTEIIFSEEGAISVSGDGYGGPLCFYNVLADYFISMPQDGESILALIVQLWSQSFASNIFSLLFHKWVCLCSSVEVSFILVVCLY